MHLAMIAFDPNIKQYFKEYPFTDMRTDYSIIFGHYQPDAYCIDTFENVVIVTLIVYHFQSQIIVEEYIKHMYRKLNATFPNLDLFIYLLILDEDNLTSANNSCEVDSLSISDVCDAYIYKCNNDGLDSCFAVPMLANDFMQEQIKHITLDDLVKEYESQFRTAYMDYKNCVRRLEKYRFMFDIDFKQCLNDPTPCFYDANMFLCMLCMEIGVPIRSEYNVTKYKFTDIFEPIPCVRCEGVGNRHCSHSVKKHGYYVNANKYYAIIRNGHNGKIIECHGEIARCHDTLFFASRVELDKLNIKFIEIQLQNCLPQNRKIYAREFSDVDLFVVE